MEYKAKSNETYMPVYSASQALKVLLIKLQNAATSLISCCFTLSLTLADLTFYNFLELFTIIEKQFSKNFPFLIDSPKPLYSLKSQNPLNGAKPFLLVLSNLGKPSIALKTVLPF